MSAKWTPEVIDAAVGVLGRHTTSVAAAAEMGITIAALKNGFSRAGRGALGAYLRPTRGPTFGGTAPVVDDIPVTVDEPLGAGWRVVEPVERILFIPDAHFPHVDRVAWGCMLQCARRFRPHRIVQLGDFLDCHTVSSHSRDPRHGTQLADEIASANEALDELDALGATHKHLVEGNHETRLSRYLKDKAPALLDSMQIEKLLRLEERGWTFSHFGQSFKVHDTYITHSVNGQAGESAHHRAGQRFQRSVVIGHTHRLAQKVFGNVVGDHYTATMLGWLGQAVDASYNHDAEKSAMWAHGFGVGYLMPDGTVQVVPVPIVRGRAVLNGEIIEMVRAA